MKQAHKGQCALLTYAQEEVSSENDAEITHGPIIFATGNG